MAATVNMQEVEGLLRRLGKALDEIQDEQERKRINQKAGQFVQGAARAKAPRSQRPHYVYNTPKLIKGERAKRGSAEKYRVKYLPGNLQLSIRVLSLRRAIRAVIGPRILRSARAKVYGRNERNVNAFYAQMIYGSAKAFRDKIMVSAMLSQEARIRKYMSAEIDKLKRKSARKNNLE